MSYLAEQIAAVMSIDETRPALEFNDQSYTWGDVRRTAEALKQRLDDLNFGPAAPVGCLLRTRPQHFAAILGVLIGDRCLVTLNPLMPDERLASDILAMRPPVIVADAEDWARPAIRTAVERIGAVGLLLNAGGGERVEVVSMLEAMGPGPHQDSLPGVAVLMLTSGTTGKPKRAPLSYRQLELNIKRALRANPAWREDSPATLSDEKGIIFSPFVHISGMYFVIRETVAGRSLRLIERFTVDEWRKAVREVRPKTAGGPPTVLKMILDAQVPKSDLASLEAMTSGTAAINPDIVDEFMRRYGLPVLSTYGATEFAGAVCGWTLADFNTYWTVKRGAAGRMHIGIEARTADPETGLPLPVGAPGVLELKGEVVGADGDWVRTSDLALVDHDRFLFILGRNDNAIVRGGFKVMPDTVVKAMETHPAIREASVVGLADERLGAVPVAAYVLSEAAIAPSDADLTRFLRERLTPYEVPVRFKRVDELPRTPSLKVSMPEVQALFGRL